MDPINIKSIYRNNYQLIIFMFKHLSITSLKEVKCLKDKCLMTKILNVSANQLSTLLSFILSLDCNPSLFQCHKLIPHYNCLYICFH